MSKNVVIVESPAKAKTIEGFLGKDYKVIASYGHVRDLPKSKLGIDIENNFEPQYIIPKGSAKTLKALKTELGKAKTIYLASDYDREGEAIAWHVMQAIPAAKGQTVQRITFAEITESAIKAAVKSPRQIDQHMVDAQQARRIVDRLVGYKLSPVLWKKLRSGLSAGRVQSVALKLIVDREREILAFKPDEYWSLAAQLLKGKIGVVANLTKIDGQKAELGSQKQMDKIVAELKSAKYLVKGIDSKEVKRSPAPPFITSSLQQEGHRKLGYGAKRTMMAAQQLYEAGHISYMRTDSYNLSVAATTEARAVIAKQFGSAYASAAPRVYKKKVRGAQEAHEAIRPTHFEKTPETLSKLLGADQAKLYTLVWQRAIASQMPDAKYLQQGADIAAGIYTFRATGRQTIFDGFTKVYLESKDDETEEQDRTLPSLSQGDKLGLQKLLPEQHFTQPPPRFSEASLIKRLEEDGIGRPSTYAPTISTLVYRGYIKSEQRQLLPQEIGMMVSDMLTKHFPFVVSEEFTAQIEDKLDDIAEGQTKWQPVVKDFYEPLAKLIESETDKIEKVVFPEIPTDEICDKCGKPMIIKTGRFGQFMACSGFPECKNTKAILKDTGVICPKDGGQVVERKSKRGRTFFGCSNYPTCDYATWTKPADAASASE